ncbi:MAG: hypothetical protein JWN70_2787 [Planctomycetaceae bacterium]|nr:hypothetical protein [Planctomycetaceae bacterium]
MGFEAGVDFFRGANSDRIPVEEFREESNYRAAGL